MKIREILISENGTIDPAVARSFVRSADERPIKLDCLRATIQVRRDGTFTVKADYPESARKGKQWLEVNFGKEIQVGQEFSGLVVRQLSFGSFLLLTYRLGINEGPVEGLLRLNVYPTNPPKVGDLLAVRISEIDTLNRIVLEPAELNPTTK